MKKISLLILLIVSNYSFSLTDDEKAMRGAVFGNPEVDTYVICSAGKLEKLIRCMNAVKRENPNLEIDMEWGKSTYANFVQLKMSVLFVNKSK